MVERPLSDRRPIGPIFDLSDVKSRMSRMSGVQKSVIGVTGTPFPNRPKTPLAVTYVLEGRHIFNIRDEKENIRRELMTREEYSGFSVDYKESDSSSKAPFDNQAFIVRIPGENLAVNDNDIHIIQDIIEESIEGVEVAQIIIDQE